VGETWDGWGSISVVFFPLLPPLTGPTADVCDFGDERDRVSLTTKTPSFSSWHFAVGVHLIQRPPSSCVHLIQRPHSSSSVSSSSSGGAARADVKSTKSNALKKNIDFFGSITCHTQPCLNSIYIACSPPPPTPPLHTKPLRIEWISPWQGARKSPWQGAQKTPWRRPEKAHRLQKNHVAPSLPRPPPWPPSL
jgi:hypothetical protein